jgi:hypothetical protein
MLIRHELETGWPSTLDLCRRVAAYGRLDRVLGFKVGITCNPKKRAALYKHKDPHYHEMIVIYKTSSDALVRDIERDLTVWFMTDAECDNMNIGGGGRCGCAPYYLYVVLREPINKPSEA